MKRYLWLPVLIVVMIAVCLVGCKTGTKPTGDQSNAVDVTVATDTVYKAMKNACLIDGVEDLFFAFDLSCQEGDEVATLVKFGALVNIGQENVEQDTLSQMSLVISKDMSGANKLLELYYAEGTLYVNYPPLINRAAISDISLGAIASTLYDSYKSGAIKAVADLLPAVGNRVLVGCEKVTEGTLNTYTFGFDYDAFWTVLSDVCQATGLGITRAELGGIMGWNADVIRDKAAYDTKISFVTESRGGEEFFRSASLSSKQDGASKLALNMSSWTSTVVTNANREACTVELPDGRSAFGTYHPANLDFAGQLVLDVTGSEATSHRLGGYNLLARLTKQKYTFDYTIKSNYQDGKLTALLTMANEDLSFALYLEDGVLYANLTDLGLSVFKIPVSALNAKLQALGYSAIDTELSSQDLVDLIVDLASDANHQQDRRTLSLDRHGLELLWRKIASYIGLEVEPLIEMDGLTVTMSTADRKFGSLQATVNAWGSKLTISADSPKIGSPVTVVRPQWATADCYTLFDDNKPLTFVVEGSINASTKLTNTTKLVEALVKSLSNDDIELGSRGISRFVAAVEWSKTGALVAFKLDFSDVNGSPICTLYYTDKTANTFYVMYPATGGITHVSTHHVVASDRFTYFVNAINGNAPVQQKPEVLMENYAKRIVLTWSQAGANKFLAQLGNVLPGLSTALDDDLGLESLSVSFGDTMGARLSFGEGNIDCNVSSFSVAHYSLEVKGTEQEARNITLLDTNNLPTAVELAMPAPQGVAPQTLLLAVDRWTYDNMDTVLEVANRTGEDEGSHIVVVTATAEVLGHAVHCVLNTDCTLPDSAGLTIYGDGTFDNAYAGYLVDGAFEFDRYNLPADHDPFTVLQHFNRASVTIGQKTYRDRELIWYYRNTPFSAYKFDSPVETGIEVVPRISTFFDVDIPLNIRYTVKLIGSKVDSVANAANFMTISAYRNNCDPFEQSTYATVTPKFTLQGGESIEINSIIWLVDSISSASLMQGNTPVEKRDVVTKLDQELYSLSGSYTIKLAVPDCLGYEQIFDITINVQPRIIDKSNASFAIAEEGISYAAGTFTIQPLKIKSVGKNSAFARSISAKFGEETIVLSSISWNVQENTINVLNGAQATFDITFGDAIGGLQEIKGLTYQVTPLAVDRIFLIDGQGNPIDLIGEADQAPNTNGLPAKNGEDTISQYEFVMAKCSAYNYAYPASVRLDCGQSKVYDIEIDYEPQGWDTRKLYYCTDWFEQTFDIYGLSLTIKMKFVPKEAKSWSFIPLEGENYDEQDVWEAPLYFQNDSGEYVIFGNRYVKYDATNAAHQGLKRYNRSQEKYVTTFKSVDEGQDPRLILDPNKVNFHCLDYYPAKVRVTFKDNTSADVDVLWPISQLDGVTAEEGFRNILNLTLSDGQKLPGAVGLWIASAKPGTVYTSVEIVDDEVIGTQGLEVSLLDYVGGTLLRNDLTSAKTLHDLLCEHDDYEDGCLGNLYFVYEDKDSSGWFAITSWQNLSAVMAFFQAEMAKGIPVQEVAGSVSIVAKVHDVDCVIPLNIVASALTEIEFRAIPNSNTSLGSAGNLASMTATGTTLTIDPYHANPLLASNYPSQVSFILKGDDSERVTVAVDDWDFAEMRAKMAAEGATGKPYLGGTFTVYALLKTGIGIDVRIPVTVNVDKREIETVYDTEDNPLLGVLTVDIYSKTPYGHNLREENGKVYAYRDVHVKFAKDDIIYRMLLRYDISGYKASYMGGTLGQNVTVEVGNEAGGYQALPGYNIYAEQQNVLRIETNDATIKKYVNSGILYNAESLVPFVSFVEGVNDSSELIANRNAAWEQMTLALKTLTVIVRTPGGGERELTATRQAVEGISFDWERINGEMVLVIQNNNALFGAYLASTQKIYTDSTKTIALNKSMFTLGSLEAEIRPQYIKGYTPAKFAKDYPITGNGSAAFTNEQIVLSFAKGKKALTSEDELVVGNYTVTITVNNPHYSGEVTVAFEISPSIIASGDITIKDGNRILDVWNENGLERNWTGYPVNFAISCPQGADLSMEFYKGEQKLDAQPVDAGEYQVRLVCADPNYTTSATFTLTIKAAEE